VEHNVSVLKSLCFNIIMLSYYFTSASYTVVEGGIVFALSIPCHQYFFHFTRILNGFSWNLWELNTTRNRLN